MRLDPLSWLKAMRFPACITPQKMAASLGGRVRGSTSLKRAGEIPWTLAQQWEHSKPRGGEPWIPRVLRERGWTATSDGLVKRSTDTDQRQLRYTGPLS